MITNPTNPVNYYGGKWLIADWIISYFPPHYRYVELCGGAASVLLKKPPSKIETYNDVERNVVTFFRVLRDSPDALIEKLELTPTARDEFFDCLQIVHNVHADVSDLERARAFYFVSESAITGISCDNPGMGFNRNSNRDRTRQFYRKLPNLYRMAARLRGVQIESRDALELAQMCNSRETLLYFDPPYLAETRVQSERYLCEVDADFHIRAAEVLRAHTGTVVISGYNSALYDDLYAGWRKVEKRTTMSSGSPAVEVIWLSPSVIERWGGIPTQDALL